MAYIYIVHVYRNFTQFACLSGDLNNFCQMNNEQQYKLYNSITTRDLRLPFPMCVYINRLGCSWQWERGDPLNISTKCIFYFRVVFHLNFTTFKLALHLCVCKLCVQQAAVFTSATPPSLPPPPLAYVFIIMAHHGPLIYVNFHCQFFPFPFYVVQHTI